MTRTLRTALTSLLLLAAFAPSALANSNYRSVIERITPPAPGLQLQVLGFDQNFLLINKTGKEVTVRGYESEPYARLLPDGTVQENLNSPATYLNSDRYGRATVPATAGANRQPQWKTLDKTGRLTWHDHRMHWMGSGSTAPPSVKDPLKRTKVLVTRSHSTLVRRQRKLKGRSSGLARRAAGCRLAQSLSSSFF